MVFYNNFAKPNYEYINLENLDIYHFRSLYTNTNLMLLILTHVLNVTLCGKSTSQTKKGTTKRKRWEAVESWIFPMKFEMRNSNEEASLWLLWWRQHWLLARKRPSNQAQIQLTRCSMHRHVARTHIKSQQHPYTNFLLSHHSFKIYEIVLPILIRSFSLKFRVSIWIYPQVVIHKLVIKQIIPLVLI